MNEIDVVYAIIAVITEDYFKNKDNKYFKNFCINSKWFEYTTLDRYTYYKRCVNQKRKRSRYGEKKKTYHTKN